MLSLIFAAALASQKPYALTPQPTRHEIVFRVAKIVCPQMEKNLAGYTLNDLLDASDRALSGGRRRVRLTGPESLLLIQYCIMYHEGRISQ